MSTESAGPVSSNAPPSVATLAGKLFVVPAIVVCLMLGAAVLVVMFGTSSIDQPATVSELMRVIEADSGDREGLMLLPAAKESWQAAQELANRFERRDFKDEAEADSAADRVIAALKSFSVVAPAMVVTDKERKGEKRDHFLILALARLQTPKAVPTIVELLRHPNATTRRVALQAMSMMETLEAARSSIDHVYPLLRDPDIAVRIVACLTVASLADRGAERPIREVASLLEGDIEEQWNAAVALAKLGSPRGKLILMNMLDRGFWERLDLDYVEDGGRVLRRLSASEVNDRLCAAILSASYLEDSELQSLIQKLRDQDSAIQVREAARMVLEKSADGKDRRSAVTRVARIGEGC